MGAIALGVRSGNDTQNIYSIAIGYEAGQTSQGSHSVAIGRLSGNISQGSASVAIGEQAGQTSQGIASVAIGEEAGKTNQHDNSIVINASGVALNSAQASSFFVDPIRSNAATNSLNYDSSTKEITYNQTGYLYAYKSGSQNLSTLPSVITFGIVPRQDSIYTMPSSTRFQVNVAGWYKISFFCSAELPASSTTRSTVEWELQDFTASATIAKVWTYHRQDPDDRTTGSATVLFDAALNNEFRLLAYPDDTTTGISTLAYGIGITFEKIIDN